MENGQGFGNNGNVRVGQPIGNPVNAGNTVNVGNVVNVVNVGNVANIGNVVNVVQPGLIRS